MPLLETSCSSKVALQCQNLHMTQNLEKKNAKSEFQKWVYPNLRIEALKQYKSCLHWTYHLRSTKKNP